MIFMTRKRFECEIERRMIQERKLEELNRHVFDVEERITHRIERMDYEINELRREIEEMKRKLDIPFLRDPITHPYVTWQTPSTAKGPCDYPQTPIWTGVDACDGQSTTTCIKDDSNMTYTGQMREE